jgi:hypothetical protein
MARLVRLNPSIQPVLSDDRKSWIAPKGITRYELKVLLNMSGALLTDEAVARVKILGQNWIAGIIPNQPIRWGDDLDCVIGDESFQAGRAHWQAL